MKKLLIALLWPVLSFAQETQPTSTPASAPVTMPTSAPSSMPASAPASVPSALTPEGPGLKRYPMLSYRLSLYPTVIGYGGALAFGTAGFLTQDPTFRPLWLSCAALGLVGPSIGHFYSGEYRRGLHLLVRRTLAPGVLALSGTLVFLASGGVSVLSSFDGQHDGANRTALLGLMVGGALISYSLPSVSILSGRHIRDAKKAPLREAKHRKLPAPPLHRPHAAK